MTVREIKTAVAQFNLPNRKRIRNSGNPFSSILNERVLKCPIRKHLLSGGYFPLFFLYKYLNWQKCRPTGGRIQKAGIQNPF
jgi:hypothetical protein